MTEPRESVAARLPTEYGEFQIRAWPECRGQEPVALVTPKLDVSRPVTVRVHSECMTGDVFRSRKCDCGEQKDEALRLIHESGNGVFIYLRQEGRGIGLFEKVRAYALQDQGHDTYDANVMLGHRPDERDYDWALRILEELGVREVRLLTNNPDKVCELERLGINIIERCPLVMDGNPENADYLKVKQRRFGHIFG